jgi:hypothetical protein
MKNFFRKSVAFVQNAWGGVKRAAATTAIAVGTGLAVSTGAQAQTSGVDVSTVVSTISAQATPIASIGGAVLAIYVGIKAYHWVKRALS